MGYVMRVEDLLITESEMLLESYKDFKRVWNDALENDHRPDAGGRKVRLGFVPTNLEFILRNAQQKAVILSSEKIKVSTRALNIKNPADITSWLSAFNHFVRTEGGTGLALTVFHSAVTEIEGIITQELEDRTPKYKVIARTPEYIAFDVENYGGATKLRNQVKSTWCIGASDDFFKQYGEDKDRKTIIVFFLKKKEGMVFHVDKSGSGLITSHDNQREWTVSGGSVRSSRGYREFAEELRHYLDQDKLVDFVKATGMRIKPEHFAQSELTIIGKLEPYILKSLVNRLESGLLARVHKATAVRENVRRIIRTDTTRAFNSGDLRAVINDVSELFGTLYTSKTYITSDESAVDFIVCTLALVEYLDDIQEVVVGGGLESQAKSATNPLTRSLAKRGSNMKDFIRAFDDSWPHIKSIILALRKVAK